MRKNLRQCIIVLLLLLFGALQLFAQTKKLYDSSHIKQLISANIKYSGLVANDLNNVRIADAYYNAQSKTLLVYLQQTYKGVDVYNALQVMAFKDDKLVSVKSTRISKIQQKASTDNIQTNYSATDALQATLAHLKLPAVAAAMPTKTSADNLKAEFGSLGIAGNNIEVKKLWVPLQNGSSVRLAWQVSIKPLNASDYWLVRVDANENKVISKSNLTVSCSIKGVHHHDASCYKVTDYNIANEANAFFGLESQTSGEYKVIPFPAESPIHPGGTPELTTNPWTLAPFGSNATTLKWNDNGTTTYTITRGNNVYAQDDHDNNDNTFGSSGISLTPAPDLVFNYTPVSNGSPYDSLNLGFALTNLFYWNNIMHDLSYQYGFDEASGNFQTNNLSRGGIGNDFVIADGQDASGMDNSNFSTPPDGSNPRMQMYLFTTSKNLTINTPASFNGIKVSVEGSVSDSNLLLQRGPITANIVVYADASQSTLACNVASNSGSLKGKIAYIDRGTCNFTNKIKNAQTAGAVGVIVANNVPGDAPFQMGGTLDNTIRIPAVMISYEDGQSIKTFLAANQNVNATLKGYYIDGDLDNGVVSHEYTHGISNRLTGGPSNTSCLENKEQMGEGWSDYFAIMATTNWTTAKTTDGALAHPIGNYATSQPVSGPGIRNYPYSTDMSINPLTYDSLATFTGGEVHNIGEIWCNALWEMTWQLIQQDGINTNLFNATGVGGNSVALKLVTEGLKLQPCSPGFIDGRDAILKADTLLYNGKYSCLIWKAFAKRGMGVKASEGSSDDYTDQVTDYTTPSAAAIVKHADKDSAAQRETVTYTFTATCQCSAISNFTVQDTLPTNITYVSGGSYNPATRVVTISGISLNIGETKSYSFVTKVNGGTYTAPSVFINDAVTGSTVADVWTVTNTSGNNSWLVTSSAAHSAPSSYTVTDPNNASSAALQTKNQYVLTGISTLSFWHSYDFEPGYDGGVVQISTDSGSHWTDLGPYMKQNGYSGRIDPTNQTALSGSNAFTGSSGGFIQTIIDLSSFHDKKVMVRFFFASDELQGAGGWFLDDILLQSKAGVYNIGKLFNTSGTIDATADTVTYIKNEELPWLSLTGTQQSTSSLLQWNTSGESNVTGFIIQRSTDSINFSNIGTAAFSDTTSTFTYTDHAPLQGINYYRIQETFSTGGSSYSNIVAIDFNLATGVITVVPNPASTYINVTISGNTQTVHAALFSASGQRVAVFDITGQYKHQPLPVLAKGIYILKMEGPGVDKNVKLMIQ
jgi:uncharacterized repeat protein (TIGR01451 family)